MLWLEGPAQALQPQKDVEGKPPASGSECWTCVSHLGQDWLSKHGTGMTPTHSSEQGKPLGKASKNG